MAPPGGEFAIGDEFASSRTRDLLEVLSGEHCRLQLFCSRFQDSLYDELSKSFLQMQNAVRNDAKSKYSVAHVQKIHLGETSASQQPALAGDEMPAEPSSPNTGMQDKVKLSVAKSEDDTGDWTRYDPQADEISRDSWVEVGQESRDTSSSEATSGDSSVNNVDGTWARETTPCAHSQLAEYNTKIGSNQADKLVRTHLADASFRTKSLTRLHASLDYVAGVLVLLNALMMLVEFEISGRAHGPMFGLEGFDTDPATVQLFVIFDCFFVVAFVLEWLLRVWFEGQHFIKDLANLFDTVLVFSGVLDLALGFLMGQDSGSSASSRSIVVLRLARALKLVRAVRMVRSLRFFQGLRVLIKACQCFLPSLCWSMVLLSILMSMGALMVGNLLQDFVENEEMSFEDRKWVWMRYGTAYRALYTLFEITFAGNWPTSARPVLDKVSHIYILFFVPYITVVVFAVIRVISAVFLKDTLDAAQNDAEQLVVDRLRKKAEYVAKLESIFMAIDDTGDGIISEERLNKILMNPKVAAYLETLELDLHEGVALFHLLDNGDGEVTLDEFIDGIMRCKGPARAIDQVAMHADIKSLDHKVAKLARKLRESNLINSAPSARRGLRNEKIKAEHRRVFRTDATAEMMGGRMMSK
mmetsp:Transcript_72953/g.170948  ORF Transcript_72953/g.170948 Transcript_72953/m.170948 type:complete len:641 (+) Transcript_72953:73-1995(+)